MRLMHGYKAVSFKDKLITSWSSHLKGAMFYKEKHWTYRHPEYGPLACFEHWEDAFAFIKDNDYFYRNADQFILPILFMPSQDTGLWLSKYEFMPINEIPHGTVFADAIYIL